MCKKVVNIVSNYEDRSTYNPITLSKPAMPHVIPSYLANSNFLYIAKADLAGTITYSNALINKKRTDLGHYFHNSAQFQVAMNQCMAGQRPQRIYIDEPMTCGDAAGTEWELAMHGAGEPAEILLIGIEAAAARQPTGGQPVNSEERKWASIFNSSPHQYLWIGPDFRLLAFNKMAAEISQKFHNIALRAGQSILDFVRPDAQAEVRNNLERALEGEVVTKEVCLDFERQTSQWFEIQYLPNYDEAGRLLGAVVVSIDIDARKRAELKMIHQNEALRQIAWSYSHEVRPPVARILGLVQLVESESLNESNQQIFDFLQLTTQALDNVVRQVVRVTEQYD